MTWDGVVTKYHKQYRTDIGLDNRTQAYVQSRVLKTTLESLTMDNRRRTQASAVDTNVLKSEQQKAAEPMEKQELIYL